MIAEFMLPREARQTIRYLRQANDLNHKAIHMMFKGKRDGIIIWFIVSALFIVISEYKGDLIEGLYMSLTLFLIVLAAYRIDAWWHYRRHMAAYIDGEKRTGIVKKAFGAGSKVPMKMLEVEDIQDKSILKIGPYVEWSRVGEFPCPQPGEQIRFYRSQHRKNRAVPDIKEIKIRYCLSNSICASDNKNT